MYRLSASVIGVLIAIMITFNGVLADRTDYFSAIIIIHLLGLISVSLILIVAKKKIKLNKNIPFYLFSGGIIGIFIVFFNNICFNNLGVSLTLALGLAGQSLASVIIDHFGLFAMKQHKFDRKKITGFLFIFLGITVMFIGG